LQSQAVTNGRASDDYAAGGNWDIGGASLLFWVRHDVHSTFTTSCALFGPEWHFCSLMYHRLNSILVVQIHIWQVFIAIVAVHLVNVSLTGAVVWAMTRVRRGGRLLTASVVLGGCSGGWASATWLGIGDAPFQR
jgi:hypothetical protein